MSRSEWYLLRNPISKIIVGHRINPALVEALKIISNEKNIGLIKNVIIDDGIMDVSTEQLTNKSLQRTSPPLSSNVRRSEFTANAS